MFIPKPAVFALALLVLPLAACGGEGTATKDGKKAPGEKDEEVDIFKDGAMQRISLKKLNKDVPAEQGKVMPGDTRADSIKGWYDSGHKYHAETMKSKDPSEAVMDPANTRGIALVAGQVYIVRNDKLEAIAFADLAAKYKDVQAKVTNPGDIAADTIVGWYDSGHNFHKEKMGSKDIAGDAVINEAAIKGVVLAADQVYVVEWLDPTLQPNVKAIAIKDIQSKFANPADAIADTIVGWYDSGHNFHKEKMGSKDFGADVIIDEAAQKGVVVGQ
jgi:hypothetical protein